MWKKQSFAFFTKSRKYINYFSILKKLVLKKSQRYTSGRYNFPIVFNRWIFTLYFVINDIQTFLYVTKHEKVPYDNFIFHTAREWNKTAEIYAVTLPDLPGKSIIYHEETIIQSIQSKKSHLVTLITT